MAAILVFGLGTLAGLILLFLFGGKGPNRLRLYRVYKLAVHLEVEIARSLEEGSLDAFGNLNGVARNSKFLIYQGFYESDVKSIARLMARKRGFKDGYFEQGRGHSTFMFKLLDR